MTETIREQATDFGVYELLEKPISLARLVDVVKTAVGPAGQAIWTEIGIERIARPYCSEPFLTIASTNHPVLPPESRRMVNGFNCRSARRSREIWATSCRSVRVPHAKRSIPCRRSAWEYSHLQLSQGALRAAGVDASDLGSPGGEAALHPKSRCAGAPRASAPSHTPRDVGHTGIRSDSPRGLITVRRPTARGAPSLDPSVSWPTRSRDNAPTPKVDAAGAEVPQRSSPKSLPSGRRFEWVPIGLALLIVASLAVALWWTA
jgi:hypothetical protein